MARLRYNDLGSGSAGSVVDAALSGSHTNSTTTFTFAAALTHNNGTAVPTLAGGDYFMLAVFAAGRMVEIVKVTAYTSGATTATVTRGQDGTSGVSHSSGAVVRNTALASDFRKIKTASASRTSGDLTATTTGNGTAFYNVDTGLDLTLTGAEAGDVVEFTPGFFVGQQNNTIVFDVCTVVSGSPVNYFSGGTGIITDLGIMGWFCINSVSQTVSGSTSYTLQSGDISSGSVTLRLQVRAANTTGRTISASGNSTGLRVQAKLIPGY